MKRTAFDERRDQRVADESVERTAFSCRAQGCPLTWSVEGSNGRCCTAHNRADMHEWPRITQWLQEAAERHARYGTEGKRGQVHHYSAAEKREIGQRLRAALRRAGGKDWAHSLRRREEAGERLGEAQKLMWRRALGVVESTAVEAEAA